MTARTPGQDPAPAPSPATDADRIAEMTAAVIDGTVLTPGNSTRTAAFDAVHADQDGPFTHALIALTAYPDKHRPAVRRTALTLLCDLGYGRHTPWQGPIEAAAARLHDPDPEVRRAAARLLVRAGGTDRARTALDELTDPLTRTALADALLGTPGTPCPPGPLRTDPLPEIRLLACLEALASAPPPQWPELDAQTLTEVTTLTAHDADDSHPIGSRWGTSLYRQDREQHCYTTATRLLAGTAGAYGQRVGTDLAHRACQVWRAAPETLTPHLLRLLPTAPPDLRTRIVSALCASRTATRLAADELAALLPTTPADSTTAWTLAHALATIDDPRPAAYLHARLTSGDTLPPGAVSAVDGLLRSGVADPAALLPALRRLLHSTDHQAVAHAARIIESLHPASADCVPDLIDALRTLSAARDARAAPWVTWPELSLIAALGRIGAPAAPALPLLQGLTRDSRHRAGHRALALSQITGDRTHVESYLHSHATERRSLPDHSALFQWLLDHGGLDADQSRRLRTYVFRRPGAMQVHGSLIVWRHEGPAATDDLLAVLPQYLDDDLFGPVAMTTLAAMGHHARPALPRLRALIDRHTRLPLYVGSEDADMRADEHLLETAQNTVAAIAHHPTPPAATSPPAPAKPPTAAPLKGRVQPPP